MATRMARSIDGFSVMGAQPIRTSDLSGIVGLGCVVRVGRIEPGLELPASAANKGRKLVRFQPEERQQLRESEFIEIKKGKRAALRLRRGRNPERKLGWVELRDLRRRGGGNF